MTKPTCPHCRVTMETGHLVDRRKGHLETVRWIGGRADWAGPVWWSVASKLKGHDVYVVVAYRCPDCGYLSSFARTSAPVPE